jgi:hypothetical protein
MADIDKKLDKIEKSCYETARKELKLLKEENDNICNQKVLEKVNLYKDELSKKYSNELNKIEREYNRSLFDYEMEERIKINNFKQTLIDNINSKVEKEFLKFADSSEYKEYLFRTIKNTLNKLEKNNDVILYITENDYSKFKDEIENKFHINLEKISNENIGGCAVIDNKNKISIDNTLKTNIEEKVKKINLSTF